METKTENIVNINGLILTGPAQSELKALQEFDNSGIKNWKDNIADLVCFLAFNLDQLAEPQQEKAMHFITLMPSLRDSLTELQKP